MTGSRLITALTLGIFLAGCDTQQNARLVEAMTLEQFKQLAAEYLRLDAMQYVVVGDAATQAERLGDLGFGAAVMLK